MKTTEQQEWEANQFAYALLMPESLIRQELAKLKEQKLTKDKLIEIMADTFNVSIIDMTYRLTILNILQ